MGACLIWRGYGAGCYALYGMWGIGLETKKDGTVSDSILFLLAIKDHSIVLPLLY